MMTVPNYYRPTGTMPKRLGAKGRGERLEVGLAAYLLNLITKYISEKSRY